MSEKSLSVSSAELQLIKDTCSGYLAFNNEFHQTKKRTAVIEDVEEDRYHCVHIIGRTYLTNDHRNHQLRLTFELGKYSDELHLTSDPLTNWQRFSIGDNEQQSTHFAKCLETSL